MALLVGMSATEWSALAAWAGVLLASVAGVVAMSQLREARRLRRAQAQPYVVAFLDHSETGPWVVDLVIKNFGTTAATDVRLTIEPAAERAAGERGPVVLPETIPTLVPGQAWRTLWDTTMARAGSELPSRHAAEVTFRDSEGKELIYGFVLDWEPLMQRDVVTVYGAHHAAEALRDIRAEVKHWKESGTGGLKVYSRDGDARDQRREEWREARRRERGGDDGQDNG
jgi:hypothetical protein